MYCQQQYIKPEMFDLIKIVIPKIMNEWEYVAYAFRYDVATVKAIKQKAKRESKRMLQRILHRLADN